MLAAVLHSARDLRIETLEDPPLATGEVRVRIAFGGICGSDHSYYHKGSVGDFAVRQPMVLGHEVSGQIIELGRDVTGLRVDDRVAVDPSRPCRSCEYCRAGRSNLCTDMRFLGSAARMPHVQGGFSQHLVVRADQCIAVPQEVSLRALACAEPLAVALHGLRRAGEVFGKRVMVTGSGPIGLLCVRAAAMAGAREIWATDLEDAPLAVARSLGAARTVNVAAEPDALSALEADGGRFDVAFEASGSALALNSLLRVVRRGARIAQLGMLPPGQAGVAVNLLQSREIELAGSFRFHEEFRAAVAAIVEGTIDVTPILSGVFPLEAADQAFAVAGDRKAAIKVHLAFG